LQVCEVRQDGGRSSSSRDSSHDTAGNHGWVYLGAIGYETVVVGFLDPFVDYGSGPETIHIRTQNGVLVLKSPRWDRVTTCLREEDRDVVVLCVGVECSIPRGCHGVRTAPLVGVESKHIDALGCIGSTGEIVLQHGAKFCDVCRGVSYGNVPVSLAVPISLQISCRRLDVGSCERLVVQGDNLIPNEEAQCVGIVRECVHDFGIGIELSLVP